jgi:hypothetical protein
MTETFFVASESMVDVAKSVGIPTGAGHNAFVDPCPFAVGDFISYPAAPSIAVRVVGVSTPTLRTQSPLAG